MKGVKSKNSAPELVVRRMLFKAGFRYILHGKTLPGKPDIVFTAKRKVIFVHGCFWHQHPSEDCPISRRPRSNIDFWDAKLDRNIARDKRVVAELEALGWSVMIVWECELKDHVSMLSKLTAFLGGPRSAQKEARKSEAPVFEYALPRFPP